MIKDPDKLIENITKMARTIYIGRYKVIEEIGRGGMGIVYRGEDPVLERPVAIKVLPPKKTSQKKAIARFLREAKVSARLDHPHIVKIYDIGEEDSIYHIVMEYVPGESLRELLEHNQQTGRVDIKAMAVFFKQLCSALDYAHDLKIIHRDIKPENIKITESGKVKLMDFGIAVLDDSHSITEAGSVMGTIAYFSPEQARGAEADYRADIYSLGVVFYEMLTLSLPFEATSISEMISKHLNADPIPPTRFNPDIPPELEAMILKALRKEPDRRFERASQMADIIEAYLKGEYEPKLEPKKSEPAEEKNVPPQKVYEYSESSVDALKRELREQLGSSPYGSSASESTHRKDSSVYKIPSPTTTISSSTPQDSGNFVPPVVVPVIGHSSQKLASDSWLAETSSSGEARKYNEFLDKVKKDALANPRTVIEEEGSSIICLDCGQENFFGQIECSRCGADLKKAHFTGSRGARAYNNQGLQAMEENDYPQAILSFREAIKCDAYFFDARINLAQALIEQLEFEETLKVLAETAETFPGNAAVHISRAECFRRMDNPDYAIDEYMKALCLDPSNINARYQLAFLYTNKGQITKAINEYRYIISIEPDHLDAHKQLGYIYAGLEHTDEAIREFERVVKDDPANSQIHTWLGDLYKKKRKFSQAEKSYTTAITIDPDDVNNRNSLGDLYMQQNRDDLAMRTFREGLLIEPTKDAHIHIADMYIKHSDPVAAISELEKVVRIYPGDSDVHKKLGELYMGMNNYAAALEHYEQSVTESSGADVHNKLGLLYLKKDYNKLSIMEYKRAVELQPGRPEYREDLGMAYYCQGQRNKAIEELKKAVTLDSRNVDYYKAIAVMLEEEGRYDEAIRMLAKAQQISPRDSLIPALTGKVYFSQGLISMALVEYQKALALQPTNYLYHIYMARAYTKKARPDLAIDSFRKAINLMPSKSAGEYDQVMGKAYIDLGKAHIEKGEYGKAREVLMSAEKMGAEGSSLYYLIGTASLNEKRIPEASKYLSMALSLEPDNPNIIAESARCKMYKGDYEQAVNLGRTAVTMQPHREDFLELYIDILIKADRISEARQFIDEIIKSNTINGAYCHYLLAKIAATKKDTLLTEKELNAAVEKDPGSWIYAKELARFFKSREKFEKAMEYYKKAISNNPPPKEFELIAQEIEALGIKSGE